MPLVAHFRCNGTYSSNNKLHRSLRPFLWKLFCWTLQCHDVLRYTHFDEFNVAVSTEHAWAQSLIWFARFILAFKIDCFWRHTRTWYFEWISMVVLLKFWFWKQQFRCMVRETGISKWFMTIAKSNDNTYHIHLPIFTVDASQMFQIDQKIWRETIIWNHLYGFTKHCVFWCRKRKSTKQHWNSALYGNTAWARIPGKFSISALTLVDLRKQQHNIRDFIVSYDGPVLFGTFFFLWEIWLRWLSAITNKKPLRGKNRHLHSQHKITYFNVVTNIVFFGILWNFFKHT